jgi:arylsulfatase A-like enzyme
VRSDICDYYFEVQRFDREVGAILKLLEERGELDRTLVVMTGDNGWPFPRGKSNLYDLGTHVPLAIRGPGVARGGRSVEDFVSLTDLAPTFLETAGALVPEQMTGQSLARLLGSGKEGWTGLGREHVLTGKERHAWVRAGGVGYPCRAIRTREFLYIRNFEPDRWPAGDPEDRANGFSPKAPYGDADGSPTKDWMVERCGEPEMARLCESAFGKRPAEELYDLRSDPAQMKNVAQEPGYADARERLRRELMEELAQTGDPRATGGGEAFDGYPYYGGQKPQSRTREAAESDGQKKAQTPLET